MNKISSELAQLSIVKLLNIIYKELDQQIQKKYEKKEFSIDGHLKTYF
jgi:hypothetical protein